MKASTILFLVFAAVMAGICIRLGFWQLDRREQRHAINLQIGGRMLASPVPVSAVPRDTASLRFTQVSVHGTPDFDHEILLTHRGREGAPGVDILTPVRMPGSDTAVIVNRGWVYSPDGMTIEPARWRESTTTFTGYVDVFDAQSKDSVRDGRIRLANYAAVSRALPYPVAPFYVVALATPAESALVGGKIIRLGRPKLDAGPHLSYALQWFGFATIALIGAGIVAARSMHKVSP